GGGRQDPRAVSREVDQSASAKLIERSCEAVIDEWSGKPSILPVRLRATVITPRQLPLQPSLTSSRLVVTEPLSAIVCSSPNHEPLSQAIPVVIVMSRPCRASHVPLT